MFDDPAGFFFALLEGGDFREQFLVGGIERVPFVVNLPVDFLDLQIERGDLPCLDIDFAVEFLHGLLHLLHLHFAFDVFVAELDHLLLDIEGGRMDAPQFPDLRIERSGGLAQRRNGLLETGDPLLQPGEGLPGRVAGIKQRFQLRFDCGDLVQMLPPFFPAS